MNVKSIRATLASIVLLGLPVADFIRDGQVSESLVGALLILAFGGGGFAADKALKQKVARWAEGGKEDEPDA